MLSSRGVKKRREANQPLEIPSAEARGREGKRKWSEWKREESRDGSCWVLLVWAAGHSGHAGLFIVRVSVVYFSPPDWRAAPPPPRSAGTTPGRSLVEPPRRSPQSGNRTPSKRLEGAYSLGLSATCTLCAPLIGPHIQFLASAPKLFCRRIESSLLL